jgi:hypothetical protein
MMNVPDLGLTFVHGEVLLKGNTSASFVPGIYSTDSESSESRFHPGLVSETRQGIEFVEGKLVRASNEAIFVPGKLRGRDDRFDKATDERGLTW